jgi:hypothetical protein
MNLYILCASVHQSWCVKSVYSVTHVACDETCTPRGLHPVVCNLRLAICDLRPVTATKIVIVNVTENVATEN